MKTKLYSKYGKLIASSVSEHGPDVSSNLALAKLLDDAKKVGIPKDIIQRNLGKADASGKKKKFDEVVYECYGAGGIGFVIEGLTDNTNRAASEVKSTIAKAGGKPASEGSVRFNFKKCGVLLVACPEEIEKKAMSEFGDMVFETALEAGTWKLQRNSVCLCLSLSVSVCLCLYLRCVSVYGRLLVIGTSV